MPKPATPRRSANDLERLESIVARFKNRRVVVLGDFIADEFVHGDIARISREAPVLILEHRKTLMVPGGGANAVTNLRALGARPIPVGVVGRDEAGRALLAELRRRGIATSGIIVRADRETPSKRRVMAGGVHTRRQQIVRIDRGGTEGELPRGVRAELRRTLRSAMKGAEGLLIADYGYGAAAPEALGELPGALARRGIPVMVDSRARIAEFRQATGSTPNQEELERALGHEPFADDGEVVAAARKLARRTGVEALLVTRGARGMCLIERGKPPLHVPAFGSDEVADVTGAGDTVIAAFTLARIAGAEFVDAARLSNYAAGVVVMKAGTATVDPGELLHALHEDLES